jgi:hypothetical protein
MGKWVWLGISAVGILVFRAEVVSAQSDDGDDGLDRN